MLRIFGNLDTSNLKKHPAEKIEQSNNPNFENNCTGGSFSTMSHLVRLELQMSIECHTGATSLVLWRKIFEQCPDHISELKTESFDFDYS